MTQIKAIRNYWNQRSEGFSQSNREELASSFAHLDLIKSHLPSGRPFTELRALDIGCGPGIMGILLAQLGLDVIGLDLSPKMLAQAKQNATKLGVKVSFVEGNAVEPPFVRETFDVIITRNLTWNLEQPALAYQNWQNLLVAGGVLMNFDGNHFYFLEDSAYEDPNRITNHKHLNGVDISVMDRIAENLELSHRLRPAYDLDILTKQNWKDPQASFLKTEIINGQTIIRDFFIVARKADL